jgi:hypothetical protein
VRLHNWLQKNPQLNFDYYLRNLDDSFKKNIKHSLERYRVSLSDSGSTPSQVNNWVSAGDDQPQDQPGGSFANNVQKQNSEGRKFGFRSSAVQPTNNQNSASNNTGGSSFRQNQSSGLRFPNTSRPMTATNAGSTGGLNKTNESSVSSNQLPEQTSTDRMNTYANKLTSMREKF